MATPTRPFGTLNSEGVFPMNPLTAGMGLWLKGSVVDKFGKNDAVGTSFEPVSVGGSAVLLVAAETLDIVSDDANDTILGTGAQKITIRGLDANYSDQEVEYDMDGTTPVTTAETWLRFFIAKVTQVGSDASSTNIGEITITGTTTTTSTLVINAVEGRTQNAQYTIPATKTGYFEGVFFTTISTTTMTGQLQVRPFGQGWHVAREILINNDHVSEDMSGSEPIPAKSDIRFMAKGAVGVANEATAGFKIIQIESDSTW